MKVLKTAAIVVGAVGIIASAGALLGPGLGLFAAGSTTAATLATVGSVGGVSSAAIIDPAHSEIGGIA